MPRLLLAASEVEKGVLPSFDLSCLLCSGDTIEEDQFHMGTDLD